MRWVGRVARIGDRKGAYRVLVGRPHGKITLGRSRLIGRIILKLIFSKLDGEAWTSLLWLSIGTVDMRLSLR